MKKCCNILFAGLGGQGVLKATDILADVLFATGHEVKKSEVHGMSQRGGSISSEVRFGEKVYSPMIPVGEADFLVALEPTQVEVNLAKLAPTGRVFNIADFPADRLENPKTVNSMMLGALSAALPEIPETVFLETLKRHLPEKVQAVNVAAFELGRDSVKR